MRRQCLSSADDELDFVLHVNDRDWRRLAIRSEEGVYACPSCGARRGADGADEQMTPQNFGLPRICPTDRAGNPNFARLSGSLCHGQHDRGSRTWSPAAPRAGRSRVWETNDPERGTAMTVVTDALAILIILALALNLRPWQ